MVLILVLVMLRLLGPTLVRALHIVYLLRAELSRPRHRLLKACADVEPVAIGRPSTHRLDVDYTEELGLRLQRASPRPSHPPHTVLPWMRPNAEMWAVHGLWGTGEGAGWDTHHGRAGLGPYPQSGSHQPPLCRAGAASVRPFGPKIRHPEKQNGVLHPVLRHRVANYAPPKRDTSRASSRLSHRPRPQHWAEPFGRHQ